MDWSFFCMVSNFSSGHLYRLENSPKFRGISWIFNKKSPDIKYKRQNYISDIAFFSIRLFKICWLWADCAKFKYCPRGEVKVRVTKSVCVRGSWCIAEEASCWSKNNDTCCNWFIHWFYDSFTHWIVHSFIHSVIDTWNPRLIRTFCEQSWAMCM